MTLDSKEEMIRKANAFKDELATLNAQFIKLQSMEIILRQDVLDCENLLTEDKTDSSTRSLVRAVFALIEGSVFNLKQVALNVSTHNPELFTKAELVMLEEVSYELNDKGETKSQTKFIPLPKNIRFAFNTAARAFGVKYELVVDDDGWSTFKEALVIRNRITHPKKTEALRLSDTEVQVVADAATWFLRNQGDLFEAFNSKMRRLTEVLDRQKLKHPR